MKKPQRRRAHKLLRICLALRLLHRTAHISGYKIALTAPFPKLQPSRTLRLERGQGTDGDTGLVEFLIGLRDLGVKGGDFRAGLVNLFLGGEAFW